ncbi:uracil-DNA glycosylase [Thalassotalea agariperforans]
MNDWLAFITQEQQQDYLKNTLAYINEQRASGVTVYPPENDVFNAFTSTPFEQVNVVILGQDPYHGANQAHGLCFSVLPEVKIPPSLVNIYKELAQDIEGFEIPVHGYLQSWAEQGVLLLNTVLTVEEGKAHSHKHLGWEQFTDKVIAKLNEQGENIIFILWGSHAHKKGKNINTDKHFVIKGPHPSPLSAYRGFFGCRHFSKINKILTDLGKAPINWQV